jgi:outer membrane protein assembly factor BamB
MSLRPTLLSLLLVLTLGGCASLNPMHWFKKPTPAEKPAELIKFQPAITLKMAWHNELGNKQNLTFNPVATLDALYAATGSNKLYKLDLKTGKIIWQISTGKTPLSAAVGASEDSEFTGTLKGKLIAWDNMGKQRWAAQLSSTVIGQPKVADGIVVARTEDGDIYGLDSATGAQKWRYLHVLPVLTLYAQPSVVIYKGAVFAGFAGGKLVALALDTGSVGWDVDVSVPHGATEIERINDVTSTPVVDDHETCAVNYQGHLACFDVHNGKLLWEKDMSSTAGLTMDDDNIYVSDTQGNVFAYEKEHGVNLWKQASLRDRQLTAPRRIGDYVVVGDYQGYVHFMSLSDGHFVARMATDGSAITAQPIEYHHSVIVQTAKGGVFRIDLP